MEGKPDHGDIVAQIAVPIRPDDIAREAFDKLSGVAETRSTPRCRSCPRVSPRADRRTRRARAISAGARPEDGTIDWTSARAIHNLVRAVAPPYPGAFTCLARRARCRAPECSVRREDPGVAARVTIAAGTWREGGAGGRRESWRPSSTGEVWTRTREAPGRRRARRL